MHLDIICLENCMNVWHTGVWLTCGNASLSLSHQSAASLL